MEAFFGVIIGAAIAAGASIGAEYLRTRHDASLDGAKRRNDRWIERSRDQRALLVSLQRQVTEYTELVYILHGAPEEAAEMPGRPEAARRLRIAEFRSRVIDSELRDQIATLTTAADSFLRVGTDDREEAFRKAHRDVIERSGVLIRDTYALEPPTG